MFDKLKIRDILVLIKGVFMKQFLIFGVFFQLLKGKTTANHIAQVYEVSPRTIYRYVNALCEAGIPVVSSQGKSGGIWLDENFDFQSFVASSTKLSQLHISQYEDKI